MVRDSTEDHIAELEAEVARLMEEVDRYRTAAEDCLQNLDWCIGYFAGANKNHLARGLSANRGYIRRHFMGRAGEPVPAGDEG
jgi:hypothetical protein